MTRTQRLPPGVWDERHVSVAQAEQARFEQFCASREIPISREAIALYLTHLHHSGRVRGRGVQYRLGLLSYAARLAGKPPWLADPEIKRFSRALSRIVEHARPAGWVEPLHTDLVRALIDATDRPTRKQDRDATLLRLAAATGLTSRDLHTLTWDHVHIQRHTARLTVSSGGRGSPWFITVAEDPVVGRCPVTALRLLRERRTPGPYVFAGQQGPMDPDRIRGLLRGLHDGPAPDPRRAKARLQGALAHALQPTALQIRDRSLILLGFAAALGTQETLELRPSDVTLTAEGMLLRLAGRVTPTAARRSNGKYCPVAAWESWIAVANPHRDNPELPAFVHVAAGSVIKPHGLQPASLNEVIKMRTQQAGLTDHYSYGSLRAGYIRTALRAGDPPYLIARHAGLASLLSVERHQHRERMILDSPAALVGL